MILRKITSFRDYYFAQILAEVFNIFFIRPKFFFSAIFIKNTYFKHLVLTHFELFIINQELFVI